MQFFRMFTGLIRWRVLCNENDRKLEQFFKIVLNSFWNASVGMCSVDSQMQMDLAVFYLV